MFDRGMTPLCLSTQYNRVWVVDVLVSRHGASVEAKDNVSYTNASDVMDVCGYITFQMRCHSVPRTTYSVHMVT